MAGERNGQVTHANRQCSSKAAIVSNLLVVLCGTSAAAPVINTGTLYT